MKVTLDLPFSLVEEARLICEQDGIAFDALIAEALKAALVDRRATDSPFVLKDGSTPSGPLKPEFEGNWAAIRDEIYRGRGI